MSSNASVHPPIKAIYGNVAILKYYCESCRNYAFVIQNEFQCCGAKLAIEAQSCRLKREADAEYRRRGPSPKIKREVLGFQNHQCVYCGQPLRGKTKIEWDHFFCFAYSANNSEHNFVAACRICNQFKAAMLFPTMLEAQVYIRHKRNLKGLPNYDYFGGGYDAN